MKKTTTANGLQHAAILESRIVVSYKVIINVVVLSESKMRLRIRLSLSESELTLGGDQRKWPSVDYPYTMLLMIESPPDASRDTKPERSVGLDKSTGGKASVTSSSFIGGSVVSSRVNSSKSLSNSA